MDTKVEISKIHGDTIYTIDANRRNIYPQRSATPANVLYRQNAKAVLKLLLSEVAKT